MNAAWFQLMAEQAQHAHIWHDPQFPPSVYYRFLRILTEALHPSLSVELGLCGGGGSLHMALGWPQGVVVGVEHELGDAHQQRNWAWMKAHLPNFVLWHGDSVDSAPEIAAKFGMANVIFIDTVHTHSQTVREFNAWLPYMADRAVVCFDDLHRAEMAGFWKWLEGNKTRLDDLHSGSTEGGFGVWWRE